MDAAYSAAGTLALFLVRRLVRNVSNEDLLHSLKVTRTERGEVNECNRLVFDSLGNCCFFAS